MSAAHREVEARIARRKRLAELDAAIRREDLRSGGTSRRLQDLVRERAEVAEDNVTSTIEPHVQRDREDRAEEAFTDYFVSRGYARPYWTGGGSR